MTLFSGVVFWLLQHFLPGYVADIKVNSLEQLRIEITDLIRSFDPISQLSQMASLQRHSLTEQQFAHLIGKCKLFQYATKGNKCPLYDMQFTENQISTIVKDYYKDSSFCRDSNGDVNLWRVLNLFTNSNKASYIDMFLDRAVNASSFLGELAYAMERNTYNWFLS